MLWTEPQVEQLKTLVAGGFSGSQIGAQLGITRSAAIGKAHRLGLLIGDDSHGGRPRKSSAQPAAPKSRRATKRNNPFGHKGVAVFFAKAPIAPEPPVSPTAGAHDGSRLVSLADLDMNAHCRWIVGESRPAIYCAADREFPGDDARGCYCRTHRLTAWR